MTIGMMMSEEERETPDPGAINLSRLISEFVGYLRREEGVPFHGGTRKQAAVSLFHAAARGQPRSAPEHAGAGHEPQT